MIRELLKNKTLVIIVLSGFILRLLFLFIGAKFYFSRENIFIDSDTLTWQIMFENWVNHGVYSINLNHEYGFFGRMPGFSFYMGFFWLVCGKNWELAYQVIAYTQIFLDIIAIFFVYSISISWFKNKKVALLSAFLYATYPFIIVWNPVVYSEYISVFLLLWSLFVIRNNTEKKGSYFFSALLLGCAILNRPQILLIVPLYLILLLKDVNWKLCFYRAVFFGLGLMFSYGLWPARNYFIHGKMVLTQDLRGMVTWDEDVLSFLQYVYSVKAEWEPQFSQIITNQKVDWPKNAFVSKTDSLKLMQAVYNSQNCSRGFSHWKGYWKKPLDSLGCTNETAQLYKELRENQIKANSFNFYIRIPLKNLTKAIFKNKLTSPASGTSAIISTALFLFRMFLIVVGILGSLLLIKKYPILWLPFGYFIALYLTLCAGTSPQMRNIEMRYLLQADVLMILPAALLITYTFERYSVFWGFEGIFINNKKNK